MSFPSIGYGYYKLIFVNCEALMNFSVGTIAVLGSVDASLDQGRLNLIY
jgi:hypothetical protein